jgi:hypothetical protein
VNNLWEELYGDHPEGGGSVQHLVQHYGRYRQGLIELALFAEIFIMVVGGDDVVNSREISFMDVLLDGSFVRAWKMYKAAFPPKKLRATDAVLCASDIMKGYAKMAYCDSCKRRYIKLRNIGEGASLMHTQEKPAPKNRTKAYKKCQFCAIKNGVEH